MQTRNLQWKVKSAEEKQEVRHKIMNGLHAGIEIDFWHWHDFENPNNSLPEKQR
jgi:hypothetical protein